MDCHSSPSLETRQEIKERKYEDINLRAEQQQGSFCFHLMELFMIDADLFHLWDNVQSHHICV